MLAGNVHGAQAAACAPDGLHAGPALNLRVDNDVFGAQDQGYSSGVQLTLVSSDLARHENDPCRWGITRWLAASWQALKPRASEQQNLLLPSQGIFTPFNPKCTDLVPNDRPYAAALLLGLGYNARTEPAAGEPAAGGHRRSLGTRRAGPERDPQDDRRRARSSAGTTSCGDEGVFRLRARAAAAPRHAGRGSRRRRLALGRRQPLGREPGQPAHAGQRRRRTALGPGLPDDFGSTPMRPADETTRPARRRAARRIVPCRAMPSRRRRALGAAGHLPRRQHLPHAATASTSEPFVADLGYGFACHMRPWKIVARPFSPHPRIPRPEGPAGIRQYQRQPVFLNWRAA